MNLPSQTPPLPSPAPNAPRRRSWGEKAGITAAFLLPLLVAVFIARAIDGNKMPTVTIPPIVSPSPNAFTSFVEAGKKAGRDEKDISDAVAASPQKAWTPAQKQALFIRNVPALAAVRHNLDVPYRDLSGPRNYDTKFPHYAHFRTLARLFVLEGNLRRETGDLSGAAQSYSDSVVFGQRTGQGAPLIGHLVSVACQAVGRKPLWRHLGEFDAATAQKAARRLARANQASAKNAPFSNTITEEKYWGQSELMRIFRKQGSQIPTNDMSFVVWTKRDVMNNYTAYMETLAENARQPYQMHPDAPPIPRDPLNFILLPVFGKARWKSVANDTQNALLVAALAARAYEADHKGMAPPDLQSLVPAYLEAVPVDPFSYPVAPLRSLVGADGQLKIYSVGADNKDDKATPTQNDAKDATAKNKYLSTPSSKGDIVAGVNTT